MANVMTEGQSSHLPGSEAHVFTRPAQESNKTADMLGFDEQPHNHAGSIVHIIGLTKQIQAQMESLNLQSNPDVDRNNERSKELALRLQEIQYQLKLIELNDSTGQGTRLPAQTG